MAQFARPDADLVDGAWIKSTGGNVDMYTMIDEAVADDTDYIESEVGPSASACGINLSDVSDPLSATGHVVRYRYKKDAAGGAQIDITVQLRQGYVDEGTQGTLIHSEVHTDVAETWTAGTFTLTAGEANSISDYNDLQLRFVANQI
jgi:hypothetical protein